MVCHFGGSPKCAFWRLALTLVATKAFLGICHSPGHPRPGVETIPELQDTSCLKVESRGCRFLTNPEQCLSSRDGGVDETKGTNNTWYGLKVKGERCVWCGGQECRENANTACEPYDFIMHGEGQAFQHFKAKATYRIAGCKNGRPTALEKDGYAVEVPGYTPPVSGPAVLVPWWVPKRPTAEDRKCLKSEKFGCRSLKTMGDCLGAKDGSEITELKGLKVHDEPCVWCGHGLCQEHSPTMCEPFDYLMYGQGVAFQTFFAKDNFHVAGCHGGVVPGGIPKPAFNYKCLNEAPKGCPHLRTPSDCLRSYDGRKENRDDGLKIHGEPCVWCGGIPCVEGQFSLCEPFDWVINGQGQAFDDFVTKTTFRMAACTYGQPFPHSYYGPTEMNPGMLQQVKVPRAPQNESIRTAPQREALQVVAMDKEVSRHMGLECWDKCGQQAGYCEWCGSSNACCRRDWSQDPAECPQGGNHSTARHECTNSAKAGAGAGVVLPRPPSGFQEKDKSFARWAWLLVPLLVVLTAVPVVMFCCARGRNKSRALLFQEGSGESESSEDEALVPACDTSHHRSQEITDDLFDTLDRNHDGIITHSDFASAFGVPVIRPVRTVSFTPFVPCSTVLMQPMRGASDASMA